MEIEKVFKKVLDCSFKVHTALGSGLLERWHKTRNIIDLGVPLRTP